MAFTIYGLMKAGLLLLNAAAVLNKARFLDKLGWTEAVSMMPPPDAYFPGAPNTMQTSQTESLKTQFLKFVIAVQTIMRVPLIFVNLFAISLELLLG